MKEISKYLIQFMNREFLHNVPVKTTFNDTLQFSTNSIEFLQKIHQNVANADIEWVHNKDKITETVVDCNNNLPKGNFYDNISPEIQRLIETHPKTGRKYNFTINTQNICVNLVLPLQNQNETHILNTLIANYFQKCLHKIYCWLYIGNIYKPSNCSQHITIYIYLTEHFKVLPKRNNSIQKSIGPVNANSALTTSCRKYTDIHLYREEEWFKVFIHETFHCLGLDFSGENNTEATAEILQMFPLHSEVNLYETYCEMFAEIINVIFYIYFTKKNNKKLSMKTFRELIQYERVFSCFQSAKVISFYNLTYNGIIHKTSHSKVKTNYKETTNVLSYYIIKSIMMFYINEYIEWIVLHNKGSLSFVKTNDNIANYSGFVREHYKLSEYVNIIGYFEKWVSRHKNANTLETTSMRMTALEFV